MSDTLVSTEDPLDRDHAEALAIEREATNIVAQASAQGVTLTLGQAVELVLGNPNGGTLRVSLREADEEYDVTSSRLV